ncbi:MAG: bifunctional tetrahydrofolate synthase/dihydrofolate synthase [Bacteroidales bacterium]|nr:bifunctional tetrahydrofolate synthase/dihydrofolate synthase [Bacteroidales bacterium]
MSTIAPEQPPPGSGGDAGNDLQAWLVRLEQNHPVEIDLGLDRIARVASLMALPRPATRIVTVAGTNGKGSCVRTLEQLLAGAGLRVGTYTSPHLLRYNERIRIQGVEAADGDICRAFAAIEAARGDISLTYFEVGTLAALMLMAEAGLDVAVLEVGLGGRFDAVNLIDADIAVITAIDIDHSHWLGSTREQIALEKAGIARPGGTVVVVDEEPPVTLVDRLQKLGCTALYLQRDFRYWYGRYRYGGECEGRSDGDRFGAELAGADGAGFVDLPRPRLPLPSVVAALQVAVLLGADLQPAAVAGLCESLTLPGRFQHETFEGRRVILDVAHNPAAAAYLCSRLRQRGEQPTAVVAALMGDKDAAGFVAALAPLAAHWYLGDLPDNPRALGAEQLEGLVYTGGQQASRHGDIREAFSAAVAATPVGGVVVVCGSFFTVAAISEMAGFQSRG